MSDAHAKYFSGKGLPTDAMMLVSIVNMKLRDNYDSIEEMCDDMDIDLHQLIDTLKEAGFDYLPEANQFR